MVNPVYRSIFFLVCLFMALPVKASYMDKILASNEAPSGIVFEVISGDKRALEKIIPELRNDIDKLRQKFPGLPIALVTHGQEQFSLLSKEKNKYANTHLLTQKLAANDVEVHVCGTHASWYSYGEEDYPDFLDVAASAPAQINDYIKLGYIHIEL